MSVFELWTTDINKSYVWTTQINKAYLWNTLLFEPMPPIVISQNTGTQVLNWGFTNVPADGQVFKSTMTSITKVNFWVWTQFWSPSDLLFAEIRASDKTTILWTSTTTSGLGWTSMRTFTFPTPVNVVDWTTYFAVLTRTVPSSSHYYNTYRNTSDPYAFWEMWQFSNSSWSVVAGSDMRFIITGT